MKGLKKIALASAIAAVSAGAQAELKALDDSTMGEMTGQAGLTIDIETKYTIGEFQYKDAGSVFLTNISLGGSENTTNSGYLDNARLTLDVAGAGAVEYAEDPNLGTMTVGTDNSFAYGFAEVRGLAAVHTTAQQGAGVTDLNFIAAAGGTILDTAGLIAGAGGNVGLDGDPLVGTSTTAPQTVDNKRTYGDGDLVLHFGFTDAWQRGGGYRAFATGAGVAVDGTTGRSLVNATWKQAADVAVRAVDFNFSIDAIGIAGSDFVTGSSIGTQTTTFTNAYGEMTVGTDLSATGGVGKGDVDGDASTTVLISNLNINGYLGPADIHIENNGNGFGAVDSLTIDSDSDGTMDTADGNIDDTEQAAGAGYGDANSKIHWGSYFNITDLDVYIDIAGVMINGLKIANTRGDVTGLDGTFAFGFAHSIRDIYAVKDDIVQFNAGASVAGDVAVANLVDGVAINTRAKFDMDIEALSFGDTGTSIGNLYWTDVESDTKWRISAH